MGLIGAGIGSLIGGGLGAISGSGGGDIPTADYRKPTINAQATNSLDQLKKSADQGVDQIASDTMQGVGDNGGKFMEAMSGTDSPLLSQAIKNRAQKAYASDLAGISRQSNISAFDTKQTRQSLYNTIDFRRQSIQQNVDAYERAAAAQAEAYEHELDAARNDAIAAVVGQGGRWIGMGVAGDAKGYEKGTAGNRRAQLDRVIA